MAATMGQFLRLDAAQSQIEQGCGEDKPSTTLSLKWAIRALSRQANATIQERQRLP